MMNSFMLLPVSLQVKQRTEIIKKCNDYSMQYGLLLSEEEIHELIKNHREVLQKSGRIEFGGGVLQKIIIEFMDSPYINQENYAGILMELQECFFILKMNQWKFYRMMN